MKFCAYMTAFLCLPFVLLAEDGTADAAAAPVTDGAEADAEADAAPPKLDERYMTILDRMPFGTPPPGFNPDNPTETEKDRIDAAAAAAAAAGEVAASEEEQQIISSVRVSVLNVSPLGDTFVGFTDSSAKPERSYLLKVGEKRTGCEWLVVSANPSNRLVKLSKNGVEATLKLGGGVVSEENDQGKDADGKDENGKAIAHSRLAHGGRRPLMPPADAADGDETKMSALDKVRARQRERRERQKAEEVMQRQAAEQARKDREEAIKEREQAAEERKAQLAQLMQIQEDLRRSREEQERRAAETQAQPEEAQPQQ